MDHRDRPSERLVEQRLRNRAMEALETLSEGDTGVRSIGVGEYVNQFFDVIDDDVARGWRKWSFPHDARGRRTRPGPTTDDRSLRGNTSDVHG